MRRPTRSILTAAAAAPAALLALGATAVLVATPAATHAQVAPVVPRHDTTARDTTARGLAPVPCGPSTAATCRWVRPDNP